MWPNILSVWKQTASFEYYDNKLLFSITPWTNAWRDYFNTLHHWLQFTSHNLDEVTDFIHCYLNVLVIVRTFTLPSLLVNCLSSTPVSNWFFFSRPFHRVPATQFFSTRPINEIWYARCLSVSLCAAIISLTAFVLKQISPCDDILFAVS